MYADWVKKLDQMRASIDLDRTIMEASSSYYVHIMYYIRGATTMPSMVVFFQVHIGAWSTQRFTASMAGLEIYDRNIFFI